MKKLSTLITILALAVIASVSGCTTTSPITTSSQRTTIVPLQRPAEEALPGDIRSIELVYGPVFDDWSPLGHNQLTKVLVDKGNIAHVVTIFNGLPIRPDRTYLGGTQTAGSPPPSPLFKVTFHSAAQGDFNVVVWHTNIASYSQNNGVHRDPYPILDDPQGQFEALLCGFFGTPGG